MENYTNNTDFTNDEIVRQKLNYIFYYTMLTYVSFCLILLLPTNRNFIIFMNRIYYSARFTRTIFN
jgi:hypothetical protein